MIEVRFHGRGGQGAKIASRILGQSGFLAGLFSRHWNCSSIIKGEYRF